MFIVRSDRLSYASAYSNNCVNLTLVTYNDMLQNMLITTLIPLGLKTEANSWENRPFRTVWPEQTQPKTKDVTRTIKKKPKRVRTAFSTEQLRTLERTFSRYKYINSVRRFELAKSLNIEEKCIKIWFQNRRMKEKRESSESSCDSSSESYGNESPPIPISPPPEVKPEASKTEYTNQYNHFNNSEYSYQLPTYYEPPQNMNGVPTSNDTAFYNDNNVYPTQYYPIGLNYPCMQDNGYNGDYGSEVNHYWPENYSSYYAHF